MLEQPMMDKLAAMRLHGMMEALQQQQKEAGMGGTQLSGTAGDGGGSPMELAAESGAGTAATSGQAARQHMRGGYRFPRGAGA